jgi:hypothetical protein
MNTPLPDEQQTLQKMDPDVKREWLKALRSGKYRRAQGKLKDGAGYCCLGVLCVTMGWEFDPEDGELDWGQKLQAGLTEDTMSALVRLNDGTLHEASDEVKAIAGNVKGYRKDKGASFTRIANLIEEKL